MEQHSLTNRIIFIAKNWKMMSWKQRAKYLAKYSPSIECHVCGKRDVEWLMGIVKAANKLKGE